MEYVFYLDIFFLTDLFLNFLALCLTAALLKKRVHVESCAAAAAVGSVWNCFLVLNPILPIIAELAITVAGVGSLMVLIAIKSHKDMIRGTLMLLIASALLEGLISFSKEQFYLTDWEGLTFAGAVTGGVCIFLQSVMRSKAIGKVRYPVCLYYRGKKKIFTALADSGNKLQVPETGSAVSLISYQDCKDFCEQISGGFFIPYRAVGTDQGLLFAITFEKMEIEKDGDCITIEHPAIAITKEPLSVNGDFNMLLPEEYVTEI